MEMSGKASVKIFDKTGTLTQGKPKVIDIVEFNEILPSLLVIINGDDDYKNIIILIEVYYQSIRKDEFRTMLYNCQPLHFNIC